MSKRMAIWYSCDNRTKRYYYFILYSSGSVRLRTNNSIKRKNQSNQFFKNGENFLDALNNLFELPFCDIAELSRWILDEYSGTPNLNEKWERMEIKKRWQTIMDQFGPSEDIAMILFLKQIIENNERIDKNTKDLIINTIAYWRDNI